MGELRAESPLWVEFSGLPEFVNAKIRKGTWSIFKKVMELDCAANVEPGVVEISLDELADRTGLAAKIVERCLIGLRRKNLLACFVPDNTAEKALLRIIIPLNTPIAPEDVKKQHPNLFPPGDDFFRYADEHLPTPEDDATLQEIIDLYFNSLGLKMNLFILDELRLIRQRFKLSDIKKVFRAAKYHEIKSLRWVMHRLFSGRKKDAKRKKRRKTKRRV